MATTIEGQAGTASPPDLSKWGKDHWSLLVYIECRCVDYKGVPDPRHMNARDRDIVDDLEDAGLVENHGTGLHQLFALTDSGWAMVGRIRRHKGTGDPRGSFSTFKP